MAFPKRTLEKPIPISPTIALDRERCILCYRCTRFSESRCRGRAARRGQPRRAVDDRDLRRRALPRAVLGQRDRALPGRRAHLDAVPLRGAAVGDPERPDGLRALPGRLQHQRDDARGEGQADPLAQPPRGRRGLALRQGPLRLRAPARRRPDRRAAARAGARGFEPLAWDAALDEAERDAARGGERRSSPRSRAPRPSSRPTGSRKLLRVGLGAHGAVLPEAIPDGLDAFRAPLSSIRDAAHRRRPLRGAGRRARTGGRPLDQGRPPEGRRDAARAAPGAGRGRVLVTDDAESAAWLAPELGARPPSTSRAHRTAAASPTRGAVPPTASRPTSSRRCS